VLAIILGDDEPPFLLHYISMKLPSFSVDRNPDFIKIDREGQAGAQRHKIPTEPKPRPGRALETSDHRYTTVRCMGEGYNSNTI
jgi:hypothetical protein